MTRNDLLRLLLAAADDVGRVFDYEEITTWPAGALEEFQDRGVLRHSTTDLHAPCPNCTDRHIEKVIIRPGPGQTQRYFIPCPESLRVEIQPEMCMGWEIDPEGLARAIAGAMSLKGTAKPVVPGRLWILGRTPWKKLTREVVLALRLHDADARVVANHIGAGGRAIVLVPAHPPDDRIWPGHIPAVVALSRVATVGTDGLDLDVATIFEIVSDADADAEAKSAVPVDPEIKKQVVRQQVKAEIKGQLNDDVLVAAYKAHGSVRKAARALTMQLNRAISKDQVQRAVERSGGVAAMAEDEDTPSVARSVASQSRDRGKKFLQRR